MGDISPSSEDQKVLGSGLEPSSWLDSRVATYGRIMAEDGGERTRSPRRMDSIWTKRSIMGVQRMEVRI